MPSTLISLIVLLFAALPGFLGDEFYRLRVGISWHEKELKRVLRLLAFSVSGLILYVFLAAVSDLPSAWHVVPDTYKSGAFNADRLPKLAISYLGHALFAAAAGLAAAQGVIWLRKRTQLAVHRDAWDSFIIDSVPNHWVVVSVDSGETYAGILHHADVAVAPENRDIVLAEPAILIPSIQKYLSTSQQHLFLSGDKVTSIATVYEPTRDDRVSSPKRYLFDDQQDEGNTEDTGTPASERTPTGMEEGSDAGETEDTSAEGSATTSPGSG